MSELGKPIRKNSDPKNRKNSKNGSKIAACEQKTTSEKANFVQTPFSHSILKLERKNFTPKPPAFLLRFLFRRDQNNYSNLTSKIMKMCPQILKKHIRQIAGK